MPSEGDPETSGEAGGLIVISGPSGAGKTSICNALLERLPRAYWSVSATTRPERAQEVDGRNYRFVSRDEFARMRERGEFIEAAEYVGNWYGTPAEPVHRVIAEGRYAILEIDVQGGMQVAEKMPESTRIFILPPTCDTLAARLEGRKTESAEQLRRRLAAADGEIAVARDSGCYHHYVVNDVLEDTIAEVLSIIRTENQCP